MKKSNPIVGITLEGFQVFEKPTYIPLDRLTLIFGPNYAGKSALQDALELCKKLQLIEYSTLEMVNGEARELLARHWRGKDTENDRVDRLAIGVKYELNDDFYSLNGRIDRGQPVSHYEAPVLLESRWIFELTKDRQVPYFGSFEFFIESELLTKNGLHLTETGYSDTFCVNTVHPLLQNIQLGIDFAEVARLYPEEVTFQEGIFTVLRGTFGFQCCGLGVEEKRGRWLGYYAPGTIEEKEEHYDLLHACVAELGDVVGNILYLCHEYTDLGSQVVNASRTVPKRDELIFQLGMPPNHKLTGDLAQRFLPSGNPSFRMLANSLAQPITGAFIASPSNLGRDVNRAFSDHLFLEQGYQISYEYRLLLSEANSKAIKDGWEDLDIDDEERTITTDIKLDEIGFLVELYLRDSKGRRHLFEDVGSGIGYILPVLCTIFDTGIGSNFCFIQQPELHLHPALQAAMGDVFLEASAAQKQILVETHSEHMLLRILKRIRQTQLQANIAPELKVKPDDICVLYFDPSPDGATIVKRLRITEDGEFMDRWPRGFFGERDLELFDE
jgi:AAA ATPase domain/Protein of unknown function (DUF3696)